jgi:hypothetical protein
VASQTFWQLALDKGVYYQVRERFGLSAQMAARAIAKLVDANVLDKRTKPMFRKEGAFPYDERILRRAQAVHRASFVLHDLHREPVAVWATSRKEKQLRHADLTLSIFDSGLHRYR